MQYTGVFAWSQVHQFLNLLSPADFLPGLSYYLHQQETCHTAWQWCAFASAAKGWNTKQVYMMLLYALCCRNKDELYIYLEIPVNIRRVRRRKTKQRRLDVHQFRWAHVNPFLFLSPMPSVDCTCWILMHHCLFPPTVSLSQSDSDCNRSSSFPALSMQVLLHAVQSLSAISKCHHLLPFSCRRGRKKPNTCKQAEHRQVRNRKQRCTQGGHYMQTCIAGLNHWMFQFAKPGLQFSQIMNI